MPAPFVVIAPLKVKVCGHVVLDVGETNADTLITANDDGGVGVKVGVTIIGVIGVHVGVATADCQKPKLKPLTVPQPNKFTWNEPAVVRVQPVGVVTCTRYVPNGTLLKR